MSITPRRVATAGVLLAAIALLIASIPTTGAYWTGSASAGPGTVTAGRLSLSTGSGGPTNYTLPALSGTDIVPDTAVQAPLAIVNTGTVPLRYRLVSAGPVPSTSSTVAVTLAGAVGGACAAGTPLGSVTAFPTLTAVTGSTAVSATPRTLAPGATETWCIRTTLISVSGTQPATYTHVFSFRAEQV